jgi:endonuclease III
VDDATREEVFRSLKARIGVSPEAILDAPRARLVESIRKGGMRPPMRADKLLLAAGSEVTLALESNGLRVLVRLGYAKEDANYAKTYRAAAEAVTPELPDDAAWLVAAHQLLRRHGQETCRRSEPRCKLCPLAPGCDFARLALYSSCSPFLSY